jgi:hypothetical protein
MEKDKRFSNYSHAAFCRTSYLKNNLREHGKNGEKKIIRDRKAVSMNKVSKY